MLAAALASLVITAIFVTAAYFVIRTIETKSLEDLRNQALKESVQNAQTVRSVSLGLQGFIHAVGNSNGDQFRAFAEDAIARHEFIREAAYYKRVPGSERAAFQAEAHELGLAFGILDGLRFEGRRPKPRPAGDRSEYYPLIHKDLRSEDRSIFGLDLLSLPGRREALTQAIESASPVLLDPEFNIDGELVAQVLVAVYDTDRVPTQLPDRARHVKGIASVTVAMVPLLGSSLVNQRGVERDEERKRVRGPKAITALDDLMQARAEGRAEAREFETASSVAHTQAWFALAPLNGRVSDSEGPTELLRRFQSWQGEAGSKQVLSTNFPRLDETQIAFVSSSFALPLTSRQLQVQLLRPLYLSTIDACIIWLALANALVVATMLLRVTHGKIVIRRINEGLEDTVAQRTESLRQAMQEIHEIQQNLEVGVFVLDASGCALNNYSPICHQLFRVDALTGRHVDEFLFVGDASRDEALARHQSSMRVVYGSDELQWEMVRPCLLDVVRIPRHEGAHSGEQSQGQDQIQEQVLKLEYAPLYDRDQLVERVLVVATDITEMLAIQASAEASNRAAALKIAIARELLAAHPEQSRDMLRVGDTQLCHADHGLRRYAKNGTSEELDEVFRELHTMKGNSRGCGFNELSSAVHQMESALFALQERAMELSVDEEGRRQQTDALLHELAQLRQLLDDYNESAQTLLGNPSTGAGSGRSHQRLLADMEQLTQLEGLGEAAQAQLGNLAALEHARNKGQCFGLAERFRAHSENCHALAESLGRPLAGLSVEPCGELYIDARLRTAVDTALVHLTRNAVDHGIETLEQRQASQKPAAATIHLAWRLRGDIVEIDIGDDGHGLDVAAIARRASKLGLVGESDTLDMDRLVDLIFTSGFSSREEVTEISGRGVGLDAVRHALHRVGADITVQSIAGVSTTFTLRLPRSALSFVLDASGLRSCSETTQNAATTRVFPVAAA